MARNWKPKTEYFFVIVSDHGEEQSTYTMVTRWKPHHVRDRFHAVAWFADWTVQDTHSRIYNSRAEYELGEKKDGRALQPATIISDR